MTTTHSPKFSPPGTPMAPRFSGVSSQSILKAAPQLSPWAHRVDRFLKPIQATRGRELLFVDIMGFTLIRTGLDLCRQYLFKETAKEDRSLNISAGRERFLMETLGFLPDFIGYLALWAGMGFDRKHQGFSQAMSPIEHVELFQKMVQHPDVQSEKTFIQQLGKTLSPSQSTALMDLVQEGVTHPERAEQSAVGIARKLKLPSLDVKLLNQHYPLDSVLEDAHQFLKTMRAQTTQLPWKEQAARVLKRTLASNWWRIPVGTMLGLGFNIVAPHLIHVITREVDQIDDFPGEQGLRTLKTPEAKDEQAQGKKPWHQSVFPYLTQSLQNGNPLPLLTSLAPLPLVAGLIDTEKIVSGGLKGALNKLGPGYWKRFAKALQYSKHAPFCGAGQMATLYSVVLAARVATARNAVEFRERAVDGLLAWSIWILGTPFLQKAAAKFMDRNQGTALLKTVGNETLLKSRTEIEQLIQNPSVLKKTAGRLVNINFFSLLGTILLLGIAEPYLSIRLTEWQSKWLQRLKGRPEGERIPAQQPSEFSASLNNPHGQLSPSLKSPDASFSLWLEQARSMHPIPNTTQDPSLFSFQNPLLERSNS